MSTWIVKPMESVDEENALRELATQSFNFSDDRWESFPKLVGRDNIRIAIDHGQVVGGMSFYPLGQWFGGRSIPMAGFALVLTGPEFRGRGYAFQMLNEVMHWLRDAGYPLATLYASTQKLYRKLGFEQAGNRYDYACYLDDIAGVKMKLPMRRIDVSADRKLLESLATQHAIANDGNLDRNDGMWIRVFRQMRGKLFAYAIGDPGQERGYLVYDQATEKSLANPSGQGVIFIRDMVALNADAMETIWAFIAGHKSMTDMVRWSGPATDARCLFLAEHESQVICPRRWMLRLLDVRQALLQRGYPHIDARVAFEVSDDLIEANNGKFVLSIREGVAAIEEGGSAPAIEITTRDFAALYSGLWTASQLLSVGKLKSEDTQAVGAATQIFGGSEPWMADYF